MKLQITMTFTPEDLDYLKKVGTSVPMFWPQADVLPMALDVVRFGGPQYVIQARVWETSEDGTVLRLYMSSGSPQSDKAFH